MMIIDHCYDSLRRKDKRPLPRFGVVYMTVERAMILRNPLSLYGGISQLILLNP
jgi:hypothetical protein